jgi:hypothetical protein
MFQKVSNQSDFPIVGEKYLYFWVHRAVGVSNQSDFPIVGELWDVFGGTTTATFPINLISP